MYITWTLLHVNHIKETGCLKSKSWPLFVFVFVFICSSPGRMLHSSSSRASDKMLSLSAEVNAQKRQLRMEKVDLCVLSFTIPLHVLSLSLHSLSHCPGSKHVALSGGIP